MADPVAVCPSVGEEDAEGQPGARHAAFFAACLVLAESCVWWLWAFSLLDERRLVNVWGRYGPPFPAMTDFLFHYRGLLLLFPAPWVGVAGWYVVRRTAGAIVLAKFVGTLALALICLCAFSGGAMLIPWLASRI